MCYHRLSNHLDGHMLYQNARNCYSVIVETAQDGSQYLPPGCLCRDLDGASDSRLQSDLVLPFVHIWGVN